MIRLFKYSSDYIELPVEFDSLPHIPRSLYETLIYRRHAVIRLLSEDISLYRNPAPAEQLKSLFFENDLEQLHGLLQLKLILRKEEHADALISAGSTGAFLSAATLILKRIPGVLRPALVTGFPNLGRGNFVTLLDVGASNTNTAEEIQQFAYMGSLYAEGAYGIQKPIVKLLSNGSEEGKGSPVGKEAFALLKADSKVDFQGNIEASQIFAGSADVVVTDGYSGNVMLKSFEGMAKAMGKLMKQGFSKNFMTKLGYLFAKSGIDTIKDTMNPKKVGGAMLAGVNGLVVKAHGNSDPESFVSAMEVASRLVDAKMIEKMAAGFAKAEQQ